MSFAFAAELSLLFDEPRIVMSRDAGNVMLSPDEVWLVTTTLIGKVPAIP